MMKIVSLTSNKGFTLIELLAVIMLITVLALFLAPNIFKYFNSSKDKLDKIQEKKVVDAAKLYFEDCMNNDTSDACTEFQYEDSQITDDTTEWKYCVTLNKLVASGYIDKVYVNKKEVQFDITITVPVENRDFSEDEAKFVMKKVETATQTCQPS